MSDFNWQAFFSKTLQNEFHEIKQSLKAIDGRLDDQGKTLVRQEENIKHHIYRTDLAEASIAELRKDVDPLKKHVAMFEWVVKLTVKIFGGAALLAGIIAGVVQILQFFIKS